MFKINLTKEQWELCWPASQTDTGQSPGTFTPKSRIQVIWNLGDEQFQRAAVSIKAASGGVSREKSNRGSWEEMVERSPPWSGQPQRLALQMPLQSGQVFINNTVGIYMPRAEKQSSRQRKPAKPRQTLVGGTEAQSACPEKHHQNEQQHKPALVSVRGRGVLSCDIHWM